MDYSAEWLEVVNLFLCFCSSLSSPASFHDFYFLCLIRENISIYTTPLIQFETHRRLQQDERRLLRSAETCEFLALFLFENLGCHEWVVMNTYESAWKNQNSVYCKCAGLTGIDVDQAKNKIRWATAQVTAFQTFHQMKYFRHACPFVTFNMVLIH